MGATGPQGPAGAGVASFDDLDGARPAGSATPSRASLRSRTATAARSRSPASRRRCSRSRSPWPARYPALVTSTPAGINCGTDCTESYARGTSVQLRANPAPGTFFVGWSGACTGTGACTVVMNDVRNVTATFLPPAFVTVEVANTLGDIAFTYGTSVVTGPNGFRCSHEGDGASTCTIAVAPACR